MSRRLFALALVLAGAPLWVSAAEPAPAALTAQSAAALDRDISSILERMDTPGASIAIVRDGRLAYAKAYGLARLSPAVKATPETRFQVGSVSKQFTAAAVLLLQADGKLSLDDPIGRYIPGLTAGERITIRQLLNHTAGYADYTPVDYLPAEQALPTTPQSIVEHWAKGALDFQPGEAWRYCNTCYVIAGLIVEKVSGEPLDAFLRRRIFEPLDMQGGQLDVHPMGPGDAVGYTRYAFGPIRTAPAAGRNWFFAAGDLTFRASDLARWDEALLGHRLLGADAYAELVRESRLKSGSGTGYSLGFQLRTVAGRKVLQHAGNVPGFAAYNRIYPDDGAAIVVMVNADYGEPARDAIVERISHELFAPSGETVADRRAFEALRHGDLKGVPLTADARAYFTAQVLGDYRTSLEPLGEPIRFTLISEPWSRGGFVGKVYRVVYPGRVLDFDIFQAPDGQYQELMVFPPG
jgi:CubicO group peptidase (beta-lactamase class C family)